MPARRRSARRVAAWRRPDAKKARSPAKRQISFPRPSPLNPPKRPDAGAELTQPVAETRWAREPVVEEPAGVKLRVPYSLACSSFSGERKTRVQLQRAAGPGRI